MKNKNSSNTLVLIVFLTVTFIIIGLFIGGNLKDIFFNKNSSKNKNIEISLTSEEAFKLIESKRKSLNYDTWLTKKAEVVKKGDNNYFLVLYTEANNDGSSNSLNVIFHYENGNWEFQIPGISDIAFEDVEKYNFDDIESQEYFELNDDLAYILIEGERQSLAYNTWKAGNVKVKMKGDNNYYLVSYDENLEEGGTNKLSTIMHYEDGDWSFQIPGFSGTTSDMYEKYNFVEIK